MNKQIIITDMFDGIAKSYDLTNSIISFNQDKIWRHKMALFMPSNKHISMLDVATGTGDVIIDLCRQFPNIKNAIGVDLAVNMLSIGRKKLYQHNLDHKVVLLKADACNLPFANHSFDVITIAFGVRNIVNHDMAIREFFRILNHDGKLIILEFSMPKNILVAFIYGLYFRYILPLIGGLLTGDVKAFRYLNNTVEKFYNQHEYKNILLHNGFTKVEIMTLSMGIATIYCAGKL